MKNNFITKIIGATLAFAMMIGGAVGINVAKQAKEVDADNLETSEEGFIITTKPDNFMNVQKALSDKLGEPENAELTWVPNMPMDLDDEAYAKVEKLVDALDANDDVQKVFTAAA